jgi:hypothetical protein
MNSIQPTLLVWRKSSASGTSQCVEIAFSESSIFVRDSKDPNGVILSVPKPVWAEFLQGAKGNDYDIR